MAELNWIDKNERLPTKDDADCQGFVIGKDNRGAVCYHFENTKREQCTHWIGFKQINECVPIPKRWRTPTIHDLSKAGKPIPCRVRDLVSDDWNKASLCAIDVSTEVGRAFMSYCGSWYYLCEIEE